MDKRSSLLSDWRCLVGSIIAVSIDLSIHIDEISSDIGVFRNRCWDLQRELASLVARTVSFLAGKDCGCEE